MEKKYDNILTVILVIAIAATLVLTGFWIYDTYTKNKVDKDALAAIEEFNNQIAQNQQDTIEEPEEEPVEEPTQTEETPANNNNSGSTSNSSSKYKNFTILGEIQIPKTNVKYPVLQEITPKALNVAVSQLYGPRAKSGWKYCNSRA